MLLYNNIKLIMNDLLHITPSSSPLSFSEEEKEPNHIINEDYTYFVKVQNKYYYQKYINYTTNPLKYAPSGFIENQKIAEVFKKRNEELCRLLLTWEEKGKCDKNSIYKHIFERIHNDIVKLD